MKFSRLSLIALVAGTACAQFGGRPGDAVVYLISSKGDQGFEAVPSGYVNPALATSRFQTLSVPKLPITDVIDFSMLHIQTIHTDPDDVFQMIIQDNDVAAPHHLYQTTFKIFVIEGLRRDYGYDSELPRDFTTGGYTTFLKNADLGPNLAMGAKLMVLGWTNSDIRPPIIASPANTRGPAVPPGKTGTQLIVDLAVLPGLNAWSPLRLKYPTVGFTDGTDIKFIEKDPVAGNVTQLLRLRPGRKAPAFRMHGNTHFYVVQGGLTLTPVGGKPILLQANDYAYIPDGLAFTLLNSRTGLSVTP